MTELIVIEHRQTIVYDGGKPREAVSVSVRLTYEAFSTGWVREHFSGRGGPTDLMVLLAIANHARPLFGDDLELLVELDVATPADEGRLYARVSDVGLADELGLHRTTVEPSARRLEWAGLIDVLDLSPDSKFRDSKGRYNGVRAYLISGTVNAFLSKSVEQNHRVGPTDTDISNGVGWTDTVKPHRVGPTDINKRKKEKDEEEVISLLRHFEMRRTGHEPPAGFVPKKRECNQVLRLLQNGYAPEQIQQAIDSSFDDLEPEAGPIRSFGYVYTRIARRANASPSIQSGPAPVDGVNDAVPPIQPGSVPAVGDELSAVWALLSSVTSDEWAYDTPLIRAGLTSFTTQDCPFTADQVYQATIAAIRQSKKPADLVRYVGGILRRERANAERDAQVTALLPEPVISRPVEPAEVASNSPPDWYARAMDELRMQMMAATFDRWLKPCTLSRWDPDAGVLVLAVPDGYALDWLKNRLYPAIQRTFAGCIGQDVQIEFVVE